MMIASLLGHLSWVFGIRLSDPNTILYTLLNSTLLYHITLCYTMWPLETYSFMGEHRFLGPASSPEMRSAAPGGARDAPATR